jgi:5-methylcytosine-specific restriction endonuclease McrA
MQDFNPALQLEFLDQLQKLILGARFTATYKLALLVALSDLAIEGPSDSQEIAVPLRNLGEKMCELYWSHATPYQSTVQGTSPKVLVQSFLRQAEIIKLISRFRTETGSRSPWHAQRNLPQPYRELVSKVTTIVSAKPVRHLQSSGEEFLFARGGRGQIVLKSGVGLCLRRFKPMIDRLCKEQWISLIRSMPENRSALGYTDDLEQFLFGSSRSSLASTKEALLRLDGAACFYCRRAGGLLEVDHFIPYSLYGRDLSHNMVLACKGCNGAKSDQLCAIPHLERWLNRLNAKCDSLTEMGAWTGMNTSAQTSINVALWAYQCAVHSQTKAWQERRHLVDLDASYLMAFREVNTHSAQ